MHLSQLSATKCLVLSMHIEILSIVTKLNHFYID